MRAEGIVGNLIKVKGKIEYYWQLVHIDKQLR
jgi:hypothetical protein